MDRNPLQKILDLPLPYLQDVTVRQILLSACMHACMHACMLVNYFFIISWQNQTSSCILDSNLMFSLFYNVNLYVLIIPIQVGTLVP